MLNAARQLLSGFRKRAGLKAAPSAFGAKAYPDFIRSPAFLTNERFLQLLSFGAIFCHQKARATLDDLLRIKQWGVPDHHYSDRELRGLLDSVVAESIKNLDRDTRLTMGVTAGHDSRPLLGSLRGLGCQPVTYTFGYPGALNFDYAAQLAAKGRLPNHILIDATKQEWKLNAFETWTKRTQDFPLHMRVLASDRLNHDFPQRVDIHGYLNDALTGKHLPENPSRDWRLSVQMFARDNDTYGFQRLMPKDVVTSLLPPEPTLGDDDIRFEHQLNLGYRQAQRIRLFAGPSEFIFPYENERWIGYWLNLPWRQLVEQQRWLEFLRAEKELLCTPSDAAERDQDQPGASEIGFGRLAPRQKVPALYECYRLNKSCAVLVESVLRRLKGRNIFHDSFLVDAQSKFAVGDRFATKIVLGLISTDLVLEADRV